MLYTNVVISNVIGYVSFGHEKQWRTYIFDVMSLEETIGLIIEVKDMPLGIEEPWHVLVGDRQRRVIGLQTRNDPK